LSIIRILEEMLMLGSQYENIVAQVFGGAEVLIGMPTNFHIGKRNANIAVEILKELKIPVIFSDIGGNRGRKISFNTLTGEVEHNLINHRNRINSK
jgi:chemotaxis protein CheD